MPDEKLNQLGEEIAALLRKHDVAGAVFMASPSHTRYVIELCPSWSCARVEFEDERGAMLLRVRTTHLPEKQKKPVLEQTLGLILGLINVMRKSADGLEKLVVTVTREGNLTVEHREHEIGGD